MTVLVNLYGHNEAKAVPLGLNCLKNDGIWTVEDRMRIVTNEILALFTVHMERLLNGNIIVANLKIVVFAVE